MAAPAAATTPTKATNDAEKAPPTPQDLAKVPPAPPRHMPSCAPTTSEDGSAPVRAPRRQGRRRGPVAPGRVQAPPRSARRQQERARGRAGATGRGAPRKGPDRRQRAAPPRSSSSARSTASARPTPRRYHKPGDPSMRQALVPRLLQFDPTVRPGPAGGLRLRPRGRNQAYQLPTLPAAVASRRPPAGRPHVRRGDLPERTAQAAAHEYRARRDLPRGGVRDRARVDARVAEPLGLRRGPRLLPLHVAVLRHHERLLAVARPVVRGPLRRGAAARGLREARPLQPRRRRTRRSIFAADDEVDDAPEEDAAFLCWADLDERRAAPSTLPHHRRP